MHVQLMTNDFEKNEVLMGLKIHTFTEKIYSLICVEKSFDAVLPFLAVS